MKIKVDTCDGVCYPAVYVARAKMDKSDGSDVCANKVGGALSATESAVVGVDMTSATMAELVKMDDAKPEVLIGSKQKRRSLLRSRVGTIVVAAVAMVAVVLVGLRLAGFRTFTVMSGSMEPQYPVGGMVYVKPVDYQSLEVGDVISFVANDEKTVVTHRIVDIEIDKTDATVRRFKTKGDANSSVDSGLVHYRNVLGTPIITIPFIGYFAHSIQQPPGIYIALVVGTLLLAWTFLPGTLEERRKTARKSVA